LSSVLVRVGLPTDLVPMIILRPFSGSAANAIFLDVVHTHGGDAYPSQLAATMLGSTETTFYVLAVYFASVSIKRFRYAIWAGLLADLAGIIAAIVVCHWLL